MKLQKLRCSEPVIEAKIFGQKADLTPYFDVICLEPRTKASPPVGFTRPNNILIEVLLPAPFGPRKPKISPRRTVKDKFRTATFVPKIFWRLRVSIAESLDADSVVSFRAMKLHGMDSANGMASPVFPYPVRE